MSPRAYLSGTLAGILAWAMVYAVWHWRGLLVPVVIGLVLGGVVLALTDRHIHD